MATSPDEGTLSEGNPATAQDDPAGAPPGLVSVVVTVLNEARHIGDLLDSLLVQEEPWEVLVVDAGSTDGTVDIVEGYARENPGVRLVHHPGQRGESRNKGIAMAQGDAVAFIDGDCIANPFWIQSLRHQLARTRVAAGRTINIGYRAFEDLHRVELFHEGMDVTYPSCNLAYWREDLEAVGGFDDRFVTAEDIDLNFRAVSQGLDIGEERDAVVYARARETFRAFVRQAYWNGYGRKQLTLKHGNLWRQYSFRDMLRTQLSFWGFVRLAAASLGYLHAVVAEGGRDRRAASEGGNPLPADDTGEPEPERERERDREPDRGVPKRAS